MSARWLVGIDLGTTHTVVAKEPLTSGGGSVLGEPGSTVFLIPQRVTLTETEALPLLPSCLLALLPEEVPRGGAGGEGAAPPDETPPVTWLAGAYARRRGQDLPARLVVSPKSWLGHAAVDRRAAILPWGAPEDGPKMSPVDASARLLGHVRRAWDDAHPEAPLADQQVVLTVPASFDEGARALTLQAAAEAGLPVRLLEEPQAAFYDFLRRSEVRGSIEETELRGLRALAKDGAPARVVVCDVGGGTTDLSLLAIDPAPLRDGEGEGASIRRVAVGRHLLLGGDNMDLALAHACEGRLGVRLEPVPFAELVLACRAAKEALLGPEAPDEVGVAVQTGRGARLVGGALSTRLSRDDVRALVLEGFFPAVPREAPLPRPPGGGLVGLGLPYERDVAITRHLSRFLSRHLDPAAGPPRALLLNGGVFHAGSLKERLAQSVGATLLSNPWPDLAVARGAVAYARARLGGGQRIESATTRAYYVQVARSGGGDAALCVVPQGAREGDVHSARDPALRLLVGPPARFVLLASDHAEGDRPGDRIELDAREFEALPPLIGTVSFGASPAPPSATGTSGATFAARVEVALEGTLTEVGTLALACVEAHAPAPRRFQLDFDVRGAREAADPLDAPKPTTRARADHAASGAAFDEALAAIERVFGKPRREVAARAPKDLVRELERVLGERGTWSAPRARAIFDAVWAGQRARRRTADHERVFWQLAGYCLRPGFGDPGDPARVRDLASLRGERLAFPDSPRGWQQFWHAWRRVAAGLGDASQEALRDLVDPFLGAADPKAKKNKAKLDAPDEMLAMAAALERVPPARRAALAGWVLDRTWTDRDPRLWDAIGKLGARIPAYASLHHVIPPLTVERWLDHLLREKWDQVPTASEAAFRLARVTGDRARDLGERSRREVAKRLDALAGRAPQAAAWAEAVRTYVAPAEAEKTAFYGEALPSGLELDAGDLVT